MRLIDADALKEVLNFVYNCAYIDSKSKEGIVSDIIDEIDNAPTVTPSLNLDNVTEEDIKKFKIIWQRATSKGLSAFVEGRQKGEWKLDSVGPYCSECKKHPDYSSDFCPFCGADMRGGAE